MYTSYVSFYLSSDPALTTHNVMEMMKGVPYDDLQFVLTVSLDKWDEIRTQYQSDDQRSEAMISYAISTHPCLTWSLIANGLRQWRHNEAAAEVTKKYVKGELKIKHLACGKFEIYTMRRFYPIHRLHIASFDYKNILWVENMSCLHFCV